MALAVALAVLAFVPVLGMLGGQLSDLPPQRWTAFTVVLILAQTVPLAIRTRLPVVCLAVVGSAFAVYQSLAYAPTFGSLGLYLALYSVGAQQRRYRYLVVLLAGVGYAALAVVLRLLGSPNRPLDYLLFASALAGCWLLGSGVRAYRAATAQRHRLAAAAAAAAERSWIARELHDVVTHHVTAMVVQADAAQVAPDPHTEVFATIGGTGRRALADLRQLLGVLEATGGTGDTRPPPTLDDLPDLAASTRSAGQPVDLAERGRRPALSPTAQLTCYRIVQEALTNAVKYAPGRPTSVRLRHDGRGTDVEVTTAGPAADRDRPEPSSAPQPPDRTESADRAGPPEWSGWWSGRSGENRPAGGADLAGQTGRSDGTGPSDRAALATPGGPTRGRGPADAGGPTNGRGPTGGHGPGGGHGLTGGRGLAGLRNRVIALGGDLAAGPRADGGFRVDARIPSGAGA